MEIIKNIEEITEKTLEGGWDCYDGYKITTDKQEILLLISNGQNCCENWGYFMSNDNINDFIGAELLEVKLVNDCLDVKKLQDMYMEETSCMFVNFETNRGTLQFTAYNSHNGYYSHTAKVISTQLTNEERL